MGGQREVWHNIKVLSGKKQKATSAVHDKDRNFIMDQKKKLNRLRNLLEELRNPPTDMEVEIPPSDPVNDDFFLDLMIHPPLKEEIHKALSKLKNQKAGGH